MTDDNSPFRHQSVTRSRHGVPGNADKVIDQIVCDSERAVKPQRRGVRYVERGRPLRRNLLGPGFSKDLEQFIQLEGVADGVHDSVLQH
jgi:hypothetical protein